MRAGRAEARPYCPPATHSTRNPRNRQPSMSIGPRISSLPQVLLRRAGPRRARLRPVDPRRRHARRRGRRALRRVLPRATTTRTSTRCSTRWRETGQVTSMLCFSPNFTHPDPDERLRQVERQKRAIDLSVKIGAPLLPDAQRAEIPGPVDRRRRRARRRGHPAVARVRRRARRHAVPRESLQGRRLALPGVRAAGRRRFSRCSTR